MSLRTSHWLALTAAFATLAACGDDNNAPAGDDVRTYITSVQAVTGTSLVSGRTGAQRKQEGGLLASRLTAALVETTAGVFVADGIPAANGGPTATFDQSSTFIVGNPSRGFVGAESGFSNIWFGVDGLSGAWRITLPAGGVTSQQVVITLASSLPSSTFSLRTAVATTTATGPVLLSPITATNLANASVAVTLTWNTASDVDLHVIDALGQEVYFDNTTTAEGGSLDLDSNPDCDIDNVNREIVSWPAGAAPQGQYAVKVYYYNDCGVAATNWSVSVTKNGTAVGQPVTGTFNGAGSPSTNQNAQTFSVP
jgi:hypothetical protein